MPAIPPDRDGKAHCHVSLAYVGATEIEIIQPIDGDISVYTGGLPELGGPVVRFHHHCRRFETRAAFDAELNRLKAKGLPLPIGGDAEGVGSYHYCDMRASLGHFVEGIVFDEAAAGWLASIPRF